MARCTPGGLAQIIKSERHPQFIGMLVITEKIVEIDPKYGAVWNVTSEGSPFSGWCNSCGQVHTAEDIYIPDDFLKPIPPDILNNDVIESVDKPIMEPA